MDKIVIIDGVKYYCLNFNDEVHEFEPMVIEHTKDIFGENCEFFSKRKIKSLADNSSIPDGFVIDFKNDKWYILENKLLRDDAIKRISDQINSYIVAIENHETKMQLFEYINESSHSKYHSYLYSLIFKKNPEFVIVIDNLDGIKGKQFKEKVKPYEKYYNLKVIEFKTYVREFVDPLKVHLHLFTPIVKKDYLTITPISDEKVLQKTKLVRNKDIKIMEKQKTSDYTRTGYTGKKIKSFEFNGKRHDVNGWIFMLLKLSEEISRLNRKDLDKLLLLKGRKRPYFTKNKNELRIPEKINGTDIFVECNLSANSIVNLCKEMLDIFDYKDDLKIQTH